MFTLWIKPITTHRSCGSWGMTHLYLYPYSNELLSWTDSFAFFTTWGVCYKGISRKDDIYGWRHHGGMHRMEDLGRYQN